jgi:hypothetical protein
VKITNVDEGVFVYCEAIPIGANFERRYNEANTIALENVETSMVINEWYRTKLKVPMTQANVNLTFELAETAWGT